MTDSVTIIYTVIAGVTIEDIADAAGTYTDTIIGDNPVLQNRTLAQCVGRRIQIRSGICQIPRKQWPNLPTRWLTEAQIRENLAYMDGFAIRAQERAASTTRAAQVADTSECAQPYVDLIHISEQKNGWIDRAWLCSFNTSTS